MIPLTMFAQVLNHPSQYPRYPVIQQTSLLQLCQGHSKLLVGFHWPGPQNGNLDHLLHVLFNQRCCLVVLQEEELISDSSQRSCAQWWPASCPGEGLLPPTATGFVHMRTLCFHTTVSHLGEGVCWGLRGLAVAKCCYDKCQVTMQHLRFKELPKWRAGSHALLQMTIILKVTWINGAFTVGSERRS